MNLEGRLLSIRTFCAEYAVGKTLTFRLIARGELEARKLGSKVVIERAAAERWANKLPAARPGLKPASLKRVAASNPAAA